MTFVWFMLKDTVNYYNPRNMFFTVSANGFDYTTSRFSDSVNQKVYPSLSCYFDVWGQNSTITFQISAVADNAGTLGDDIKLDISSAGSSAMELSYTYDFRNYSSRNVYSQAHTNGTSID